MARRALVQSHGTDLRPGAVRARPPRGATAPLQPRHARSSSCQLSVPPWIMLHRNKPSQIFPSTRFSAEIASQATSLGSPSGRMAPAPDPPAGDRPRLSSTPVPSKVGADSVSSGWAEESPKGWSVCSQGAQEGLLGCATQPRWSSPLKGAAQCCCAPTKPTWAPLHTECLVWGWSPPQQENTALCSVVSHSKMLPRGSARGRRSAATSSCWDSEI